MDGNSSWQFFRQITYDDLVDINAGITGEAHDDYTVAIEAENVRALWVKLNNALAGSTHQQQVQLTSIIYCEGDAGSFLETEEEVAGKLPVKAEL